eukprot:3535190-Pyramimonas_sp.AAC.1
MIPTWCYGGGNVVDVLDVCGCDGGIPQLKFSRGLFSGGNLDNRSYVDLAIEEVQDAAMHYLD